MALSITIVTTANKTLRYIQTDTSLIQSLLESLKSTGNLFSHRSLIIGSASETQILAPSAITRIEIDGGYDLSPYFPPAGGTPLSTLPEETGIAPQITEDFLALRIDFFFEGGDSVKLLLVTERATNNADRMMRITRIFEQPIITYALKNGGIGLMNPTRMTRVKMHSPIETLPQGTWQLDPI